MADLVKGTIERFHVVESPLNEYNLDSRPNKPYGKDPYDIETLIVKFRRRSNYESVHRVFVRKATFVNYSNIDFLYIDKGELYNYGIIKNLYVGQNFPLIDNYGLVEHLYWTSNDRDSAEDTIDDSSDDSDLEEMPDDIEAFDLCSHAPSSRAGSSYRSSWSENRVVPYKKPPQTPIRCSICFRSARDHDAVSTFCGHIYCKNCLKYSMKLRDKMECPMCKEKLPEDNPYHRVHL